jgi:hypothetical protein
MISDAIAELRTGVLVFTLSTQAHQALLLSNKAGSTAWLHSVKNGDSKPLSPESPASLTWPQPANSIIKKNKVLKFCIINLTGTKKPNNVPPAPETYAR